MFSMVKLNVAFCYKYLFLFMAQSFKITSNALPGVACVAPGLATPDVGAANDGGSRPRSSWILGGGNGSSAGVRQVGKQNSNNQG